MAEHDLVVRGGTVIDGTGVPRRTADVAVSDGVVVGSALIRAMAQAIDDGADHAAAGKRAAELLAEIRRGVDSVAS